MEIGDTSPENVTSDDRVEKMLAEYERAQEVGQHTDTVIHEISAIVWGANTLLLGFILEVDCKSDNQKLVIVAAVAGIFMSIYVPLVMRLMKMSQQIAYAICREIEKDLSLTHQLNTKIHEKYPKSKLGQKAVWGLTYLFIGAWGLLFGTPSPVFICSNNRIDTFVDLP